MESVTGTMIVFQSQLLIPDNDEYLFDDVYICLSYRTWFQIMMNIYLMVYIYVYNAGLGSI